MRGFIVILLVVAVLAFSGYATFGETGPIGWLNAAQASRDGSYSRAISAIVLLLAICLVVLGVLQVLTFFQNIWRARSGQAAPPAAPAPVRIAPAPAAAAAAPMAPVVPKPAPSGWRMGLTVWAACIALTWICVFAWYGWDWHLRRADVVSAYAPLQLSRGGDPVHPGSGSHLALQGGLLWDHALTRRSSKSGGAVQAIFVPVAAADWRQGDRVDFVAQFDSTQQLYDFQRSSGAADATLLVRVDGAVPAATRPVFERDGVLVADNAVLVTAVASQAGRPAEADPAFNWTYTNLIGGIVSGCLTLPLLAAVLGLKREAWMERRRAARAARKSS
ncbi:hypothetical protein LRH25_02580 [Ideonella azotifigens]|uniref:Cytochrome c biogenesis protein ResB n=1 Tax=Ideonella azotifigens TaxID=513160 RepID=A0ABP3VY88_9BURK|nr:hypothetical protein [Ideonella azotifigens]MCD2339221.1 hypothetical protein [Ideonella azotifigens]